MYVPYGHSKGMSTGYYMYTYVRDDFLAASFPLAPTTARTRAHLSTSRSSVFEQLRFDETAGRCQDHHRSWHSPRIERKISHYIFCCTLPSDSRPPISFRTHNQLHIMLANATSRHLRAAATSLSHHATFTRGLASAPAEKLRCVFKEYREEK